MRFDSRGFRYALETWHKGKWSVNVASDDRELVQKFYDTAVQVNAKRPARLIDRSTGDVVVESHPMRSIQV